MGIVKPELAKRVKNKVGRRIRDFRRASKNE